MAEHMESESTRLKARDMVTCRNTGMRDSITLQLPHYKCSTPEPLTDALASQRMLQSPKPKWQRYWIKS